jgi:putative heme-binding domain-containing protein
MMRNSLTLRTLALLLAVAGGQGSPIDLLGKPLPAAPPARLILPPGFRSELVYAVPLKSQGSWVALAVDPAGRLIASDQAGGLYRVTPSPLGQPSARTKVEKIPLQIGMAQGLACVGDKLYLMLNGQVGSFGPGVYRLSDSDHDDQYDRVEQLRVFRGGGEHGPHGFAVAPNQKSLFFCCGNMTPLPFYDRSRATAVWAEDQLLPRLFDPHRHANDLQAPGGWIARMDLDGEFLEIVSVGFRNPYDLAVSPQGDLFTFDADMEWDIGTSWYRPTRVCHVTSGADFGWRAGDGKWPAYYPDTLPAAVDVGPGSPTGMVFGTQTRFPPEYRESLFAGDWGNGCIYRIDLRRRGASYQGRVESFARGSPLAVTDLVVRPQDGALYFVVGGRQTASQVWRIVWDPPTADTQPGSPFSLDEGFVDDPAGKELAAHRRLLESWHVSDPRLEKVWPDLGHADRTIRYAARTALERCAIDTWWPRLATEHSAATRLGALLAAARTAKPDRSEAWIDALVATPMDDLSPPDQIDWIRTASVGITRWGIDDEPSRLALLAAVDQEFPSSDRRINRELANLLVRLRAPALTSRLLDRLEETPSPAEAIDMAVALSVYRGDWTLEERRRLLTWFDETARAGGNPPSIGYVVAARDRFLEGFSTGDRDELGALVARVLDPPAADHEKVDRQFVRDWKMPELIDLVSKSSGPRDLQRGARLYVAASCAACHRKGELGAPLGPDLTSVGRRFSVADLLRAVVEPNHQISDLYQQTLFEINGRMIAGRIRDHREDVVAISTSLQDPKRVIQVPLKQISAQYPANVSMMPAGLLNSLDSDEILDLIAFLQRSDEPILP